MNLFWKYHKYHWKAWMSAILLSIILGVGVLIINMLIISLAYWYDRFKAEKEIKAEKKHQEIISTFKECRTSSSKKTNQTSNNKIWGEA